MAALSWAVATLRSKTVSGLSVDQWTIKGQCELVECHSVGDKLDTLGGAEGNNRLAIGKASATQLHFDERGLCSAHARTYCIHRSDCVRDIGVPRVVDLGVDIELQRRSQCLGRRVIAG